MSAALGTRPSLYSTAVGKKYVLAISGMVLMGYQSGLANSRRSIAAVALILGFSLVLYLIADLDRPGKGVLQVSQQSMIDLQKSMK